MRFHFLTFQTGLFFHQARHAALFVGAGLHILYAVHDVAGGGLCVGKVAYRLDVDHFSPIDHVALNEISVHGQADPALGLSGEFSFKGHDAGNGPIGHFSVFGQEAYPVVGGDDVAGAEFQIPPVVVAEREYHAGGSVGSRTEVVVQAGGVQFVHFVIEEHILKKLRIPVIERGSVKGLSR